MPSLRDHPNVDPEAQVSLSPMAENHWVPDNRYLELAILLVGVVLPFVTIVMVLLLL